MSSGGWLKGRRHFSRGIKKASGGQYEEALHEFEKARECHPKLRNVDSCLGEVYIQLGRNRPAEEHLKAALDGDPTNPVVLHYLGRLARDRRNFKAAADFQQRALAQDPVYAEASLELGRSHLALGDRAAAVSAFERCARLEPDVAESRLAEFAKERGS